MNIIEQFYPLLIAALFIILELFNIDMWFSESLVIRLIMLPVMFFIIYLAYTDLANTEEITFSRIRWIGFAVVMILLSGFSIIMTGYMIISSIINYV